MPQASRKPVRRPFAPQQSQKSQLEEAFANQVKVLGLPKPKREFKFHGERGWRFDFAWPDRKVAVEIEGGIWVNGGHSRGKAFMDDCEKYNEAALEGWMVLRIVVNHIRSGSGFQWLQRALAARQPIHLARAQEVGP